MLFVYAAVSLNGDAGSGGETTERYALEGYCFMFFCFFVLRETLYMDIFYMEAVHDVLQKS